MSVPLELSLSFTHIKTPQLIGIIAGCLVFTATISAVVLLLYKSGTLSRFRDEMMSGTPLSLQSSKKEDIAPQSSMLPELYEHLLSAALTLPIQPSVPELRGKNLLLRPLETDDLPLLIAASNGTALYGESAYDPARIWGWINSKSKPVSSISTDGSGGLVWPCRTEKEFMECYRKSSNSQHLVLIDRVTQKQIGILSLVDNRPEDLNIRIDNLWITPAFQRRKYSHEAFYHLLKHLFESNYRRVTVEVDIRNIIMRKFLERCGFQQESIMRKHRIVDCRNRDTAVYVLLNSDWDQINVRLKKILGLDLYTKMHKIAEIEENSITRNEFVLQNTILKNKKENIPLPISFKEISNLVSDKVPNANLSASQKNRLKKKKRQEKNNL